MIIYSHVLHRSAYLPAHFAYLPASGYYLLLYSLATMVCYFSCVGQVTSVSSGSGVRVAEVLISEGTVGGLGEDRSFQVYFWPGLGN